MTEDLKYPIGKFSPEIFTPSEKEKKLLEIEFLPTDLEMSIQNLDEHQLQTPYRPGGWTIHQLVHHIADSHMNCFIRFKLGLTEDHPTIKIYDEKLWANLDDVKLQPVNVSITLLHALHRRWHSAIKNLNEMQWERTLFHPEQNKDMSLWDLLCLYAWHGKHHVKHILALRERMKW
ncbi:MAG: putative metal-dependent hydrolase [Bacteroidetes bacterium]|nr:putative metal-dependent hydrolase [Bacteroidota bacterium]